MIDRLIALVVMSILATVPTLAHAARPTSGPPPCPADTQAFSPTTGAELQHAVDCAGAGATITLIAGKVYEGNFTLRHKATALGTDGLPKRITIKSDRLETLLEQIPQRVTPSDESLLAWLKVPSRSTGPLISTELRTTADGTTLAASHYHFAGIKFFTNQWVNNLVKLGTGGERLVSELPDDITFDRSYFAGSPGEGTKQGLVANGRNIVVTNSYFKDFKDTANDAQAIVIWNGAGPFHIENNYLEGSGENIMVGGGDPTIEGLVPTNITIRGNHLFKPTRWTFETSSRKGPARGNKWRIKNLFELKNAQDVVFEGNVLENNWIQADQHGFAVLFSTRNQDGGCPWCRIKNVTMSNNLIENSTAGIKFLVTDYSFPSGQLENILIRDNVLVNINANAILDTNPGDRAGRLIEILNPYPSFSTVASPTGPVDLTIDHNTAFSTREVSFSAWSPISGVTVTNNVARHNRCATSGNDCGISGDGTAPGLETFDAWFKDPRQFTGNILFDASDVEPADYFPFTDNAFPTSVMFRSAIDLRTGRPASGSSGAADYTVVTGDGTPVLAPDGKKVGADWDALKPRIDAAIEGRMLPVTP